MIMIITEVLKYLKQAIFKLKIFKIIIILQYYFMIDF